MADAKLLTSGLEQGKYMNSGLSRVYFALKIALLSHDITIDMNEHSTQVYYQSEGLALHYQK